MLEFTNPLMDLDPLSRASLLSPHNPKCTCTAFDQQEDKQFSAQL